MIEVLLNFFGVEVDGAQQVSSVALELRHVSWLGWMVFLALLLSGCTWYVYRYVGGHRSLSAGHRRWLTALRISLLLLIIFLLLRPVLSFTIENRLRRLLIVLVDDSGSMELQDPRRESIDLKRAALATGAIREIDDEIDSDKTDDLQRLSRSALLRAALGNSAFDLLPRLSAHYDVSFRRFAATVAGTSLADIEADTTEVAALVPDRQTTALGEAIREIAEKERGQPVAGIFLATDGANNAGVEPLEAAIIAGREGLPLYIYGVGITSPRDIIVAGVFTPDIAFLGDEVPVTVRMRAQGLDGEKAILRLQLGDREVASQEIELSSGEEMVVPLRFVPEREGSFELTASVEPRDDETVRDNNAASQRLRVIDRKIRVLVVEETPRWEFRHLENTLTRDRRLETKFWLRDAAPEFVAAPGSPYLPSFPATREELFEFDLVLVGDVPPEAFSSQQFADLGDFVTKFGGALGFIAGRRANPQAYADTPLANLLPVEMKKFGTTEERPSRSTQVLPSPAGREDPMLRLDSDDVENLRIWESLPPIQWTAPVGRAKPGAQVLLEDADPARTTRFGRMPIMVLQRYGLGQTLLLATDNTWRWRRGANLRYYSQFWAQVVQRLALPHLLGGSKRTQLSVDRPSYSTGESVVVMARLYDESYQPIVRERIEGTDALEAEGAAASKPAAVTLRAVPEQPGMYRAEFTASQTGLHRFKVEGDAESAVEFEVKEPRVELAETAMNLPVLQEMARLSGGQFFREESLAELPDVLQANDERIQTIVDADVWASPFIFVLLLGLAASEWILRKRWELK